jgi:septal ring factor EnvC (AmiA/AmiB activator)
MIGRQEQLKLLLNQSNPAGFGRTLAYYGYFAQERSGKIDVIQTQVTRLQQLVAEIEQQSAPIEGPGKRGRPGSGRARACARLERADALAALTKQVASGNQELAALKREEQAVESWWPIWPGCCRIFPSIRRRASTACAANYPGPCSAE